MSKPQGRGVGHPFWRSARRPDGAAPGRRARGRSSPSPRAADQPRDDSELSITEPVVSRRLYWALGAAVVVATIVIVGLSLRVLGFIDWAWALVLSPFTAVGVVVAAGIIGFLVPQWLVERRPAGATTPAPDQLDPPAVTDEADFRILVQHPEILAALCHGFRMKRLLPSVLGQAITDPWGVYKAALTASPGELDSLRMLAALHTARLAGSARKDGGRLSDAQTMRSAVDAFRPCASRAEAGKGHPDCPFEHVTVIFGAKSPSRDANLKSVAPKVRALLERQYPQLKTARLTDGSDVRFTDWGHRAAQDRSDMAQLRAERDRQEHAIRDLRAKLDEERARVEALRAASEAHRRQVLETARTEQAQVVADLRAAVHRADIEHGREIERQQTAASKLEAANEALAIERDSLELALLGSDATANDGEPAPDQDLSGVRVLLVGGEAQQTIPLREHLEARGAQLVHDDSVAAAEHVAHVQLVVFWIRYLSHPTYFAVRHRVRTARVPHRYWGRTSPSSLVALVASAVGAERPAGANPGTGPGA